MNSRLDILYLSQEDLVAADCFNIPEIVAVVEEALAKSKERNIIFPPKVTMVFDEESQSRINCLPGGNYSTGLYGMKWVSVFPNNPHRHNRPNISAVMLLSELRTGFPVAFMDGTLCSALRAAGVSAVAARHLALPNAATIGFIGAGEQAKAHFMTLKHVLPSLKICKVSSRTGKTERCFIAQLSALYPEVEFIACDSSYQKAAEGSAVIVTAISGQEKILQADWISAGTFYCHVAGLEDDFAVARKADKIVCDEWSAVKHRTQTLSRMFQAGELRDEDIYADLHEIVKKEKLGRVNNAEFIYFNAVGLSYIDIALATYMYRKALSRHCGQRLNLQKHSIFEYEASKFTL